MKRIMKIKSSLTLLILFATAFGSFAQGKKASLGIGDDAPALKYSKWIKGTPVTSYEKDRYYVVEFWATWCGPCKAAMPHLSSLAKKYKDNATFIGMNIWEKTGDEPYESSLPAVTKYVTSVGDNMAYNVAADNNAKDMVNNWMVPAGQIGIPATFLIKDAKIIWIGHPMNVDSIINASMNGKYDIASTKKKFEESKKRSDAMVAKMKTLDPITKAYKAKDYDKANLLLDSLDVSDPMIEMQKRYYQFSILLDRKKEAEAKAYGDTWIKENVNMGQAVASVILDKEGLSKETYIYAAELYKKMLTTPGVVSPYIHGAIATAYAKAGDYSLAIAEQELAVKEATAALNEKKFIGTITPEVIAEFNEKLTDMKSKVK